MDTPCRRKKCGHPKEAHLHYRPATDCALCECLWYRPGLSRRGRWLLAGFGFSLAAAALTGYGLVLLFTGYHGVGVVWCGLGAMALVAAGSAVAYRGEIGGPGAR